MSDVDGLRAEIIEAMSWAEDFDTGRLGSERAAELLDRYVDSVARERAAEALEDAAAWFMADDDVPVRIPIELHARAAALADDGRA